jgi:hypothetical protein
VSNDMKMILVRGLSLVLDPNVSKSANTKNDMGIT